MFQLGCDTSAVLRDWCTSASADKPIWYTELLLGYLYAGMG